MIRFQEMLWIRGSDKTHFSDQGRLQAVERYQMLSDTTSAFQVDIFMYTFSKYCTALYELATMWWIIC